MTALILAVLLSQVQYEVRTTPSVLTPTQETQLATFLAADFPGVSVADVHSLTCWNKGGRDLCRVRATLSGNATDHMTRHRAGWEFDKVDKNGANDYTVLGQSPVQRPSAAFRTWLLAVWPDSVASFRRVKLWRTAANLHATVGTLLTSTDEQYMDDLAGGRAPTKHKKNKK